MATVVATFLGNWVYWEIPGGDRPSWLEAGAVKAAAEVAAMPSIPGPEIVEQKKPGRHCIDERTCLLGSQRSLPT